MGARRIPNATNEKIIALMSMGKTSEQAAFAVGASGSYCNKLYTVTEAADDICQTISTARKLNEDCINANFDVLTATLRDGVESVKTTIRKGRN